jgi:hypothetical protein
MLAPVRVEVVQENQAHGRKLWRATDGPWRTTFAGLMKENGSPNLPHT